MPSAPSPHSIGLPEQSLLEILGKALNRKGEAAITASTDAIRAGIDVMRRLSLPCVAGIGGHTGTKRWSITGNEAVGLGALRGGVRFVAAYPITPATEVLEWLAPALDKVGGVLVQAEDELSSINQIIGASFGGVPALTATSGPGLALMMESIGLAVAAEIPIVVVNVMRGGPSTGIPTKSEQTDLNIALYGLHGDAPHLVVAPTSVADCLFTTQWGVQLAEALQTPAIVLSDQSLGQTRAVLERPADLALLERRSTATHMDTEYERYAILPRPVFPRWPSRVRQADNTRRTAWNTMSRARLQARPKTTGSNSTKDTANCTGLIMATTGPTSRARAISR